MNVFDEKRTRSAVFNMYLKNWKIIVITVLSCTILSIVATSLMTERFRAKASFFVPYEVSLEKTVEDPKLGYDTEADRLLQILNSERLKDSVVKKFDLVKYFKIDTSDPTWPEQLTDKYRQRVFCNRTNIMSIVVEAETYDPKFSTEIVNYIVAVGGRFRQEMYKANTKMAADVFKQELDRKQLELDSLAAKIGNLRKDKQGNYPLLKNMIIATQTGSSNPEQEILSQQFIYEQEMLSVMKSRYENARNIAMRPIPEFYNIDPAYPIYKPAYPLVGFNIAMGFFGSLFLILAALYFKYVVQQLRK